MVKVLDMVTGKEIKLPEEGKDATVIMWKIGEDRPVRSKTTMLGNLFNLIFDLLSLE